MTPRVVRIARTVVSSPVELQEAGVVFGKTGRHPCRLGIDSEMHDPSPREGAVVGVALLVLLDHVVGGLPGEIVLQFNGGDRLSLRSVGSRV